MKGDVQGNHLATTIEKQALPHNHISKPMFAGFKAEIKEWDNLAHSYTDQEAKHLGHQPRLEEHLKSLTFLKDKPLVPTITQPRTVHIPFFIGLHSQNIYTDSTFDTQGP